MGGNTSRTFSATSVFNESLAQVTYDIANKCAANTGISQTINLRGATVKGCPITQDASSSVNFQCLQTVSFGADFKNKFDNVFRENLSTEIANLGLGSFNTTEQTSLSSMVNRVSTNINTSSLSTCIADSTINQAVNSDGAIIDCTNGGNIAQSATLNLVSKCTQNNTAITNALTEIDNMIKKKMEMESSMTSIIIGIVAIIGLIIAGLVAWTMMGSSSVTGSYDVQGVPWEDM